MKPMSERTLPRFPGLFEISNFKNFPTGLVYMVGANSFEFQCLAFTVGCYNGKVLSRSDKLPNQSKRGEVVSQIAYFQAGLSTSSKCG